MREIKFRAWIERYQKYMPVAMIYFEPILGKIDYIEVVATGGDWAKFYPEEVILEQYTGLKDKNGKEIYEGDIVEQFVCGVHQFKGKECGRKTLWQVRWNEEECCFELHYLSGSLFGDSMMSNSDEYEVIGNIHENPELLEE